MVIDPYAQMILASMIKLAHPGASLYSQVPIAICDSKCQKEPMCTNHADPFCAPPIFNKALYREQLKLYPASEAVIRSFTRPETYKEGLVRYAVISQAISNVTAKTTLSTCKESCAENDLECTNKCTQNSLWSGERKEISFMLLTILNEESAFRADIHGGVGESALGDCDWTLDGKKVEPWTKHAYRVFGTCESYGLAQPKIGKGEMFGFHANDLVGVDLHSTENTITLAIRNIARFRWMCAGYRNNIAKATFMAYGAGKGCMIYETKHGPHGELLYAFKLKNGSIEYAVTAPENAVSKKPLEAFWAVKRAKIFQNLYNSTYSLSDKDKEILEKEDSVELYNKLESSGGQIQWMISG